MSNLTLILCIPINEAPEFPAVAYRNEKTTFTASQCDDCGRAVWLGTNCEKLWQEGIAKKVCAFCAVFVYGVTAEELKGMVSVGVEGAHD